MQMEGGEKLRQLEANWVGLVSKNYEIEQACAHLEREIIDAGYESLLEKLYYRNKEETD